MHVTINQATWHIPSSYATELITKSHANHILPVPFNFLVGPERAGNWDVRGHRHYAGLLQAATRNSIESAVMLQISVRQRFATSFSHYSIPNHVIFPAVPNLINVHLYRSNLFWQNNFEIVVLKVQTSFSILHTGTATTSIILTLAFPEFFHHSLSIARFIILFIILSILSLKEPYILGDPFLHSISQKTVRFSIVDVIPMLHQTMWQLLHMILIFLRRWQQCMEIFVTTFWMN